MQFGAIVPPPTDRTTLLHCVEILRSGIAQGVDAIKGILLRWVGDLRWSAVLELGAIATKGLTNKKILNYFLWGWATREPVGKGSRVAHPTILDNLFIVSP